jgi:hypothetical protein
MLAHGVNDQIFIQLCMSITMKATEQPAAILKKNKQMFTLPGASTPPGLASKERQCLCAHVSYMCPAISETT